MMNLKSTAIMVALALAASMAHAQTTEQTPAQAPAIEQLAMGFVTTPEAVLEQATPAVADAEIKPQNFNQWVRQFEQQFQRVGKVADGRTFFKGQAAVRVGPLDRDFGKELAMAYEKAMFDMRADFVLLQHGRLTTRTIRDIYENHASNKDAFDPVELEKAGEAGGDKLEAMFDKAIGLMDKALDNALIEQGVPADQVQKQSVEQKRTNYKNNLQKEIVKSAYRSMRGLVPVQTRIFTQSTPNGKVVSIGVIAVQSEKTRQFALDMSRKRPTSVKGTPKKISDLLPQDEAGYLNEIGLRFSYDEAGQPMLIAYGRYSLSISPDWKPSRIFQSKQNATSMAESLAQAMIIEFMNTNVQVNETTLTGSQEEELVAQMTHFENGARIGAEQTNEQLGETLGSFLRSGQSTASGDLRGASVVQEWEQEDENNIVHVGAVVAWTYDQLNNANAIDAQNRGQSSARGEGAKSSTQATSIDRGSKAINRVDDF